MPHKIAKDIKMKEMNINKLAKTPNHAFRNKQKKCKKRKKLVEPITMYEPFYFSEKYSSRQPINNAMFTLIHFFFARDQYILR